MAYNNIFLSPHGTQIKKENLLDSGTLLPGQLITETATGVVSQSVADAVAMPVLIADLSVSIAGAIDTEYNTTDNQRVNYRAPVSGELVVLILADVQTIAVGDQLAPDGNGNVKAPAAPNVGVYFTAKEAVTTSGAVSFIKAQVI
jgi:hypothetical protein